MKIVHNLELSNKSLDYLKKVFTKYEEVKFSDERILKDPVIHMYPTGDTLPDEGSSIGYEDALLVTVKMYDFHSNIFMKIQNRDALDFTYSNVDIKQVRVFKDGSTMAMLSGEYKFDPSQNVVIHKAM